MRTAFLGTGIMGLPMARNIAAAGIECRAWNRTAEKATPLRDDGVELADDPAAAIEGADLVITMLSDGDAVEAVMIEGGGLKACGDDAVWAQMSTVGLAAGERLAEAAADAGVGFVDAPVLGTKQPAEQGALTVLAAGPEELRETCQPVFDAVGQKTIWMDEGNRGQRLKMVANSWVLSLTEAAAESLALAEGLGVEKETLLELIEGGPLDSAYAQMKGKMMISGEFEPSFPLALAAKDAELIVEAAAGTGANLPLQKAVSEGMRRGVEQGHGDDDMAATFEAARPR
jgi:3-hydroxyisobutyrate dehydrogenase